MNLNRTYASVARVFVLSVMAAGGHAATISISLVSPALSGAPGDALTFAGTISNQSGSGLYITGATITLAGFAEGDTDLTDFILNATGPLADGASIGPVDFFILTIPGSFPIGQYTGTLLVQGGLAEGDDGVLGSVAFEADVNPSTSESPEPQPLWMLAPGIGVLALARCRRARKS